MKLAKSAGIKIPIPILIGLVCLTDITIFLNIPFLRQILGFLFLTILPGLLILQILKLEKLGFTEKFVLSVGLSISFLLFFGLLINNLSLVLGYKTPLATTSLLILFNLTFLILMIIEYKVNKEPIFSLPNLNLNTCEKAFLIVPVLFPVLSIFGMNLMNTVNNNSILIFLLFLIPIYVVFVCLFHHKFPKRLYPVVIFFTGISLPLMFALRSSHIIGVDRHQEYYFFLTTLSNLHWSVLEHSTLDACLSISLLPTIYQSILNINPEYLYKILIPLMISILPLIIYILSKKHIGEQYAFLASFFFMSQHLFVSFPGGRTNVAVLFFALAIMVLFNHKIEPVKKRFLFIIFVASGMVSHYSTTYIFFFIMLGVFIGIEALSKKYTFKKSISLAMVLLFFALIVFWYSQVTEAAFNTGVRFFQETLRNLNKFFVQEVRSEVTQSMLGKGIMQKGIPHKIEFVGTWLIFAFIGIGVITLITRYKEMSFPELKFKKLNFLKQKFEVEYFIIALVCSGLLAAVVLVPYITVGYSLERTYFLGIVVLSVFFVIGGIILSRYLKVQAYLIILLVLVPYFLSVTGATYQMFDYPQAITLNSEGRQYEMYVHDQESYSAEWLREYGGSNFKVCVADAYGGQRLVSQGKIPPTRIDSSSLQMHKKIKGYIYLRYYNVVDGKLIVSGSLRNMTEYSSAFTEKSKIYVNGGSQIYR